MFDMFPSLLCALSVVLDSVSALSLHEHRDGSFTPHQVLRVKQGLIATGGRRLMSALVNGSMPGPTVRIPEDKAIWIRVYNDMEDANLTMHWHGLAQAAYPFSDGTPLASQWPIPPRHFFDYELKAENGSAGSYFYHSHVGMQALTVTGPLIVQDSGPWPYPSDGERLMFLQELWEMPQDKINRGFLATPAVWPGEPYTWLINGKAANRDRSSGSSSSSSRSSKAKWPSSTSSRTRFIAATALSLALLAFENHTRLDIVQADGGYTKPHPVDMIQIGSGQRFEALLSTKTCDELDRLHNRTLDFYIQLEARERPGPITSFAILRYKNTCGFHDVTSLSLREAPRDDETPLRLPATIEDYLDYKLEPLMSSTDRQSFPTAAEVTRRVILTMQQVRNHYQVWTINNESWSEEPHNFLPHTRPEEPYLVSLYRNRSGHHHHHHHHQAAYSAALAHGGLDPVTKTYPARMGEVIEVVLQHINTKNQVDHPPPGRSRFPLIPSTHPWHAHGAHYWDAGGGRGLWDAATAEKKLRGTRPVRRDTTMVYGYGREMPRGEHVSWRLWRMRVTQPGVWMVHCHTTAHMLGGMQTVWVHGSAEDLLTVPRPEVDGYLEYGGDAYGKDGRAPRVLHFHG
ncbi:hypothetical protein L249_3641 [Ophiocordyceps polyrhachis-furcata BCC 54312]|uniref:L-ascorbate oxidase n=1 Tax=Ophiocordyceps polyrhachis-furcata BCC 54312 TaxID=1330021 RepID=A0A367L4R0_9HYPO|nr:hypothetical protein L249_3641 [Ophiocordyceps polyrhachis-furcata BCC 54312]